MKKSSRGRERVREWFSRKEDFWGKQEDWVQIPSTYLKTSDHGYIGLEPWCWFYPVCSSAWHFCLLLRLLVQRLFFQNHWCLGMVYCGFQGFSDPERYGQRQESLWEMRKVINRWKQGEWLLKSKSMSVRRAVPDGWVSDPVIFPPSGRWSCLAAALDCVTMAIVNNMVYGPSLAHRGHKCGLGRYWIESLCLMTL